MIGNDVELASSAEVGGPSDVLDHRAQAHPDQTALIAGEDVWTYHRLATESERLARALLARGVRQGDRVVLHMVNLPELVVAYYACFRLGAIAAPLNVRLKTAELRPLLQRLRPALYLGQDQLYPQVASIEPEIISADARFIVGDAVADDQARPWASLIVDAPARGPMPRSAGPDVPAVLLATSGSTGQPKLAVHTPATLTAIAASFTHLALNDREIVLHALPLVHAAGLATLLGCVHFGAPMVLLERFDPDLALDAIAAHRCSWMLGLSFVFAELLQRQQEHPRVVGSLRHCLSSGDVCPPELQRDFAAVFRLPLRSFLASTEAGASLTYGLQSGPVSRIAPGTEVRVVDDADMPVPRGQVGELLVRSPSVSPGYWAGPGRVEAAPEGSWFHTGDLVRQGEGEEVWFIARKKELIVRGGSNIAPAEVEQALMTHPAVHDAAVIGVPDPMLGQRLVALVELASEAAINGVLESIHASVATQLADYKVPEQLQIVDTIPKTAIGKTDRKSLQTMVVEAH